MCLYRHFLGAYIARYNEMIKALRDLALLSTVALTVALEGY
jgi:hypothetical protein